MVSNYGKKWIYIFFIILILVVVSVSGLVGKVFTSIKEPNISMGKGVDDPLIDKEPPLDAAKDNIDNKKEKSHDILNQSEKELKKKIDKKGGSGNSKDSEENIQEEEQMLNLWIETLIENGITQEFFEEHIEVADYEINNVNSQAIFKIYLKYTVDWATLDLVLAIPLEDEVSFTPIKISKSEKIKNEILKNIHIFKERTLISKNKYIEILKNSCFSSLNITDVKKINPQFRILDNYVNALFFDYILEGENKCALSTINLEDEEASCKEVPCIKIQFVA
jgi:hypothetical protein